MAGVVFWKHRSRTLVSSHPCLGLFNNFLLFCLLTVLPQDLCSSHCLFLKDSTFWVSFSVDYSQEVMVLFFLVLT